MMNDAPTFHLRYGGPAEARLHAALTAARWVDTEDNDDVTPALLYLPFSRIPWAAILSPASTALCAAYPVRTALVNKAALAATLRRARGRPLGPPTLEVGAGAPLEGVAARLAAGAAGAAGGPFIVKCARRNNASGVRLAATPGDAAEALRALGGGPAVVQRYVPCAPLLRGHKFHARVNVLCVGSCAVYAHAGVVCHVACEPLSAGGPFAHITNHCVQRAHPAYSRGAHTLLLPALLGALGEGGANYCAGETLAAVRAAVARVWEAALRGKALQWERLGLPAVAGEAGGEAAAAAAEGEGGDVRGAAFLPHPRCFELFGLDFLLLDEGAEGRALCPMLLEINGGPALEGLALPALCAELARDTVALVLPPEVAGRGWAAPPVPGPGSGWARVF